MLRMREAAEMGLHAVNIIKWAWDTFDLISPKKKLYPSKRHTERITLFHNKPSKPQIIWSEMPARVDTKSSFSSHWATEVQFQKLCRRQLVVLKPTPSLVL